MRPGRFSSHWAYELLLRLRTFREIELCEGTGLTMPTRGDMAASLCHLARSYSREGPEAHVVEAGSP